MFANTYLHQTFIESVSNQYKNLDMPDVTTSHGMPIDFVAFSKEFSHGFDEYSSLNCCIFTKLSHFGMSTCHTNMNINII